MHFCIKTGGITTTSKQQIEARRKQVLRYYLRGLNSNEIARQLNVHRMTINRDVKELKVWIRQEFDQTQAYTVKRAFLTRMELFREAWTLYHRKPPEDQDDFFRKVTALQLVMNAQSGLEKISGIADLKIEVKSQHIEINAELIKALTDLLMTFPLDLRKQVLEAIPDDYKLERDTDDKGGSTELQ